MAINPPPGPASYVYMFRTWTLVLVDKALSAVFGLVAFIWGDKIVPLLGGVFHYDYVHFLTSGYNPLFCGVGVAISIIPWVIAWRSDLSWNGLRWLIVAYLVLFVVFLLLEYLMTIGIWTFKDIVRIEFLMNFGALAAISEIVIAIVIFNLAHAIQFARGKLESGNQNPGAG